MKCLIAYLSFSQNTKEIAEHIANTLSRYYIETDLHCIMVGKILDESDIKNYDLLFFGTFTWSQGSTPDEMKDFIADIGYKPQNVAIFGSGDTQFGGDEYYCAAVDKLVRFYNSPWRGLKIEQSPRGSQEASIVNWTTHIMQSLNVHQKKETCR